MMISRHTKSAGIINLDAFSIPPATPFVTIKIVAIINSTKKRMPKVGLAVNAPKYSPGAAIAFALPKSAFAY